MKNDQRSGEFDARSNRNPGEAANEEWDDGAAAREHEQPIKRRSEQEKVSKLVSQREHRCIRSLTAGFRAQRIICRFILILPVSCLLTAHAIISDLRVCHNRVRIDGLLTESSLRERSCQLHSTPFHSPSSLLHSAPLHSAPLPSPSSLLQSVERAPSVQSAASSEWTEDHLHEADALAGESTMHR